METTEALSSVSGQSLARLCDQVGITVLNGSCKNWSQSLALSLYSHGVRQEIQCRMDGCGVDTIVH